MIAMAFFVWFCSKYVWPPFIAIMEERRKKIADGLEAAARSEKDLELAQVKSAEKLKEAKSDAAAIIDQANKRAAQIVDEAKEQAREEGQRIIAGANAEIEQEVNRAKEALRSQVSAIAVAGAERYLRMPWIKRPMKRC
jgi:F-type H+-transporting ATPase subunit b